MSQIIFLHFFNTTSTEVLILSNTPPKKIIFVKQLDTKLARLEKNTVSLIACWLFADTSTSKV